jgi:hypothetical protein
MKFRGLQSVVVERDERGRAKRREIVVTSVFARGLAGVAQATQTRLGDARLIWADMALSFTGSSVAHKSRPIIDEEPQLPSSAP